MPHTQEKRAEAFQGLHEGEPFIIPNPARQCAGACGPVDERDQRFPRAARQRRRFVDMGSGAAMVDVARRMRDDGDFAPLVISDDLKELHG
jgi:hypothetical protein